ncbi:MAG: hypothetical protein IJB24_06785 [Clostridia bacterium]|nr:hypothetical protein [Clostridia bacterium]MBQ4602550.1 hypothetical protein [Clostridia bacterium]
MYIFKRNIDKKKLIRYGIYGLFFIILAVVVSLCAIWIKYKVMDFEAMMTEPEKREYSIYYNSLNHKGQLLYNSITAAAEELSEESEVLRYSYDMEEFQKIIGCIRGDRPELFYIDYDNLVLYHSNHRTKVGMVYLDKVDAIPGMIEEYNSAIERAMEFVLPSMTDYEKEIAINDWLLDNCCYALGERNALSSTSYGALVRGQAYCDGYAYAAKQLLNKAYIDALVVYGEADGAEHVWNMVEIEGQYYHLDVMWNDADIGSDSKLRFHGYFNLSDDMIKLDHSYENDGIIPYAVTDGSYYKETGCYAATGAELEEVFYDQLLKAVKEKREYIELLCPETKSNEDIGTPYTAALKRVNSELGYEALYEAFSVYDATARDNSVTIQIYYN